MVEVIETEQGNEI